jgi:hypothetical protein
MRANARKCSANTKSRSSMMLEIDESILRASARCPADAGRYLSFPAAMRSPSAPIFIIFPNLANIRLPTVSDLCNLLCKFSHNLPRWRPILPWIRS